MHEIGLCEGLLAAVTRRAAGRRVTRVRVRAGIRHGVDAASMAQAFQFVAQGSEAEDAAIELVTVPARLTCRRCGHTGETTDLLSGCPRCRRDDVELSGGDELVLESLEYAAQAAGHPTRQGGRD